MDSDATEAALGLLGLSPSNLVPAKRKQADSDDISCICGISYDDGFSIACDDCSRWCHAACFDIVEGEVPEEWRCWLCVPRPVDRERAVRLQRARLRLRQAEEQAAGDMERHSNKRRASPGIERKQRRASTATNVPGTTNSLDHKRNRRLSSPSVVDIDDSWSLSYVHIPHDIIPHQDTREKLRRQAQHWRGVTALDDQGQKTTVRPLPSSSFTHPALSLYTNPSVRPPSYAMHTSTSIPSDHLITPYTSTITPSSSYLSDPLNSYAHLGMPKPFVHLIGPPLDVSLDSRIAGNSARFVRSGCRPNAVLRPYLCKDTSQTLSFGVFALRDLNANEEVVLGWEWDDGHVVHNLPALIETPDIFPTSNDTLDPGKLQHIRNQMSNILHVLSSTFTTCACGAQARNCAITQMAAFVDGEMPHIGKNVDLGPLVGVRRGFKTKERVPFSGGLSGVEMCEEESPNPVVVVSPASPSHSNGQAPVGHDVNDPRIASRKHQVKTTRIQCPGPPDRPPDPDCDFDSPQVVDPVPCEDKIPPKMRKKWIHRESEALREKCSASPAESVVSLGSGVGLGISMEVDVDAGPGTAPKPSDRKPDVASPSSSFAQLTLVSPVILGPTVPASGSWTPLTRIPSSIVDEADSFMAPRETEEPGTAGGEEVEPRSREVNRQAPLTLSPPSSPCPVEVPMDRQEPLTLSLPLPPCQEAVCPTTEVPEKPPEVLYPSPLAPPLSSSSEEIKTEEGAPTDVVEYPTSSPTTSVTEMPTKKVKMSLKDFALRRRKQKKYAEQFKNAGVSVSGEEGVDNMDMDEQVQVQEEDVECEEGHEVVEPSDDFQVSRMDEARSEVVESPVLPPDLPKDHPRFIPIPPVIETRQTKQELIEPTIRLLPGHDQIPDPTKWVEPPTPQPRSAYLPRSHTPPTQPRSFNASPLTLSPSPSNASITSSTSRRPSLPPYRSSNGLSVPSSSSPSPTSGIPTTTTPLLSRPVPSGPRALRGAVNIQPPPSLPFLRSFSGPQYIPRGPSADRDRIDGERERAWQRSRVRGPGWGR